MDERLQHLEDLNKLESYFENDAKIYPLNFDVKSSCVESDISSTQVFFPERTSKETIELSLEVEIANSLKQLLTAPERRNSPLVDVTIIRPSNLDQIPGLNTQSPTFNKSEIRHLVASMERQRQHKKRLLESNTNQTQPTSEENPEVLPNQDENFNKHLLVRKQLPLPSRRRHRRPENIKEEKEEETHVGIVGTPTTTTINYRLDALRTTTKAGTVDHKQPYIDGTSISILKPLVGQIRKSLKHLEAKIVEGGDHQSKESKPKRHPKHFLLSNSSSQNFSETSLTYNQSHRNTHQIYTTANTFEKLRTLLACQNNNRDERESQEKEKPCLCQHCGMIGVLIDSQKGPVVPTFPLDKPEQPFSRLEDDDNEFTSMPRREFAKFKQKMNTRTRINDENGYKIIYDLASRLDALENRIMVQEQTSVPREYFKRIINKLLNQHIYPNVLENRPHLKNNGTQYSKLSLAEMPFTKVHHKYEPKVRHKNVQIQQNTRRNYYVHPLFVQTDSEPPLPSTESRTTIDFNKTAENKDLSSFSGFISRFGTDKDDFEKDLLCPKINSKETFWRWGEEVIKPGIDLKTKILSLLDERFQSTNQPLRKDSKNTLRNTSKLENGLSSTKNDVTSPVFDTPKPFEDRDQKNPEPLNIYTLSNSSSQALKKVLDFMSEKIYNDHVKPTLDAIKQEQKCPKRETTAEAQNVKQLMKNNFCNTKTHESQITKVQCDNELPSPNETKNYKNPHEPVKLINRRVARNTNALMKETVFSRKSAIPVRVANTSPTDLVTTNKCKENPRSLIPRLKSPTKDCPLQEKTEKTRHDAKFFIRTDTNNFGYKPHKEEKLNYVSKNKKQDEQNVPKTAKNINTVKVTYVNPNIGIWNEESSGSVPFVTSEETKMVLTDTSSASHKHPSPQTNIREDTRRIAQNHSLADKLAILTNIASTEMEKAQLWSKIWNQAKHHCKSKQDTVIIQVPTKNNCKVGMTEVEFTIEDIQKLVNDPKLIQSIENLPSHNVSSPGNMESFLLIRSRKILEDVHKRLGNKFLKNN